MKKLPRSFWWLVAVWAAVLLAPPLRALWSLQTTSSPFVMSRSNQPEYWQKAAQLFPNDLDVLAQAAEEITPVSEAEYSVEASLPNPSEPFRMKIMRSSLFPGQPRDTREFEIMRRYDQLLQKFPDDIWLIARRLRFALSYYSSNRVGGELSDSALEEHQRAGKPSPERTQDKPNFTDADLQRVIAFAKRGQKLEPNNSFFDWALCNFLLMGWRDQEAWQALDSGARKNGWNEHLVEDGQSKVAAFEKACGRTLLWEEKLELHSGIYLAQYSHYRETARIISWEGIKAKRRGDHAQALRLWGNMARAAKRMREGSNIYLEGLSANAIEAIAFGNANYNPRRYLPGSTLPRRVSAQQRLAAFQAYAKQHGRADLAREAARETQRKTAYINRVRASTTSQGLYGVPFWQATVIGVLWQLGILLCFLLPGALFMCFVLDALFRNRRARALLQMGVQQEKLSRREVIGGALACGGLRALGSTLLTVIVAGLCVALFMAGQGMSLMEIQNVMMNRWNAMLPIGMGEFSFFESLAYATLAQFSSESASRMRWIIVPLPIFLGLLYVLWRAGERQQRQNGETPFRLRDWFFAIVRGDVFDAEFDFARVALKLFDFVLYAGFAGAYFVLAATLQQDFASISAALLIVLFCGGVLGWRNYLLWHHRPRRREASRYALQLWRAILWAWLVLGSTLYLLTLLVALPLRAKADAKLDNLLRYGEVRASQKDAR
jgi:hypothetical protein